MRAREHTEEMLRWWARMQVQRADLAVRRSGGQWLWQLDLPLQRLPLAWARAENARGADVYVRPARHHCWPMVFLDDLDVALGIKVVRHYPALLVRTSREGGCHLWLRCARPLDEQERRQAQRHLAARTGADPASTSGEHLGRLAGMKNYKRAAQWVGILGASIEHEPWEPRFRSLPPPPPIQQAYSDLPQRTTPSLPRRDTSPSGMEWGWTIRALVSGLSAERVYSMLVDRCSTRRGPDAHRYARRTVERAMTRLGLPASLLG